MIDKKKNLWKFAVEEQASGGRLCYYMLLYHLHTKTLGIKHLCEENYAESVLCCLKRLAAFWLTPSILLLDFQF